MIETFLDSLKKSTKLFKAFYREIGQPCDFFVDIAFLNGLDGSLNRLPV